MFDSIFPNPITIYIYDNWFSFLYQFSLALSESIYKYITAGFNPIVIATISFFIAFMHPLFGNVFLYGSIFSDKAYGIREHIDKVMQKDFYFKIFMSGVLLAFLLIPVKIKFESSSSILVPKNVYVSFLENTNMTDINNYIDISDNEYKVPLILGGSIAIVDTILDQIVSLLSSLTGLTDFKTINVNVLQQFMDSWTLKDIEEIIPKSFIPYMHSLYFTIPATYPVDLKEEENVNNLKYSLALYSIIAKSLYGVEYKNDATYLDLSKNPIYTILIQDLNRFFAGKERDFVSYLSTVDSNVDIKLKYNETNHMFNEVPSSVNTLSNMLKAHPELVALYSLIMSWYDYDKNTITFLKGEENKLYNFEYLKKIINYLKDEIRYESYKEVIENTYINKYGYYPKLIEFVKKDESIPLNTFGNKDNALDYYTQLEEVLKFQKTEVENIIPILNNYRIIYSGIVYALNKDTNSLTTLINNTTDDDVKQILTEILKHQQDFNLIRTEEAAYIKQVNIFYTNMYTIANSFLDTIKRNLISIGQAKEVFGNMLASSDTSDIETVLKENKSDFLLFTLLDIPVNSVNDTLEKESFIEKSWDYLKNKVVVTKESILLGLIYLFFFIFMALSIFLFILYLIQRFIAFVLYFTLSPFYILKAVATQTFGQSLSAYFASWVNFRAYDFGLLVGFIFIKVIIKILNIFSIYLSLVYSTGTLGIKLAYMSLFVLSLFLCVQIMKFVYLKITKIVNNKFDVVAESLAKISDMALGQAMALGSAAVGLTKTAGQFGFKALGAGINLIAPGVGSVIGKAGSVSTGATGQVAQQAVKTAESMKDRE